MSVPTRVFVDTNIFVSQFDVHEPAKQAQARALIKRLITEADCCVSTQVIQEFLNVAIKKHAATFPVAKLKRLVDETFAPLCAHLPSPDFYHRTLALHATHSLGWYDALIVQAALDLNCDILYSEDLQAGQTFGQLTIKNPFAA